MVSPIKGYTQLSDEQVGCVNDNKLNEERLLRVLDIFQRATWVDGRWLAIARTHFQQGFMALNRAIMKPERIALPEDGEDPSARLPLLDTQQPPTEGA